MKTIPLSCPGKVSPRGWLLPAGLVVGLIAGWGSIPAWAADAAESVPPAPELRLQTVPVLRLEPAEAQAKTKLTPKAKAKLAKAEARRQKRVLTGSNIPEEVSPGRTLASASHVLVIDRREMNRTGAQTASQLFGRMPYGR